jgi:hypothetical protein
MAVIMPKTQSHGRMWIIRGGKVASFANMVLIVHENQHLWVLKTVTMEYPRYSTI